MQFESIGPRAQHTGNQKHFMIVSCTQEECLFTFKVGVLGVGFRSSRLEFYVIATESLEIANRGDWICSIICDRIESTTIQHQTFDDHIRLGKPTLRSTKFYLYEWKTEPNNRTVQFHGNVFCSILLSLFRPQTLLCALWNVYDIIGSSVSTQ